MSTRPLCGVCAMAPSRTLPSRASRALSTRASWCACAASGRRRPPSFVSAMSYLERKKRRGLTAVCCLCRSVCLDLMQRWQQMRGGVGTYGHRTTAGFGYHGQSPLGFGRLWTQNARGFGLPWAKFTWVWAIMGTNTRGFGLPCAKPARFWATVGKVYLGLGDHGLSLSGFGLPRAKFIWVWATTGTAVYNGRPL